MSRRILIIDVEPELLSSLKELMEMRGYQVITLLDLRKIFEVCNQMPFDVILSHWVDPYLRVDEVFDQLKLNFPQTKYVIMTGAIEVNPDIEEKYPFIYKPFQIDDFERLIKTI